MTPLKRQWKIYAILHSHTDIGYTERQEKIEQFHVNFIRQAINISEAATTGERPEWKGYKWTCETFWAVERFLEEATEDERNRFVKALRRGDIELSGTYLNMTELVDSELMSRMLQKACIFAKANDVVVNSAMTADINGYSWGYAQALVDAGIEHLLSCVHTHHGMFALGHKQTPFYWETPNGDKLLVWNGEHYMIGNDLGLNPDAVLSYSIRDEFPVWGIAKDHWELAETRIHRYLNQLEEEGYPYDFVLVNVMGLLRDNAAPNGKVVEFAHQWNEKHKSNVTVEITTLSRFFEQLKTSNIDIPVYRGDWPDWWTDGVVSTAMHTQIFRDAQRQLQVVKRLDANSEAGQEDTIRQAEYQLTMYAEHTWGYHSSISEPWNFMVQQLGVRKEAYASNGSRLVYKALDRVLEHKGEALLGPGRSFRYMVINPYDQPIQDIACIYLEGEWETVDFEQGMEVVDDTTSNVVLHQYENVSRGRQISIPVALGASEERTFTLRPTRSKEQKTTSSTKLQGLDGVYDLEDLHAANENSRLASSITQSELETPFVHIRWNAHGGITSWVDKTTGSDLIDNRNHGAFTPVYEVTEAPMSEMSSVRRKMGRNRKGMNVLRSEGTLTSVKEITRGPLYSIVELTFDVRGSSFYSIFLKAYNHLPRVDVSVRLHKDSIWEPENLYISLPFSYGNEQAQLWLDKAGGAVRPGIDQLPGTLTDFYCVQEGITLTTDTGGLIVAMPDTPLLQTGPLEFGTRKLSGQNVQNHPLYAWVLTNYWETNFKASLGGFYEFRYSVQWGEVFSSVEQAFKVCRSVNTGPVAYRFRT